MRKTETFFEQIPLQKVKEMLVHRSKSREGSPQLSGGRHNVLTCTICRQPVRIETAKTDGNGQAIHEECYMISVAGKSATSRTRSNPRV